MITKIVPKYLIKSVHQVEGLFGEHTFNVILTNGRTIHKCYLSEENTYYYKKTTR